MKQGASNTKLTQILMATPTQYGTRHWIFLYITLKTNYQSLFTMMDWCMTSSSAMPAWNLRNFNRTTTLNSTFLFSTRIKMLALWKFFAFLTYRKAIKQVMFVNGRRLEFKTESVMQDGIARILAAYIRVWIRMKVFHLMISILNLQ